MTLAGAVSEAAPGEASQSFHGVMHEQGVMHERDMAQEAAAQWQSANEAAAGAALGPDSSPSDGSLLGQQFQTDTESPSLQQANVASSVGGAQPGPSGGGSLLGQDFQTQTEAPQGQPSDPRVSGNQGGRE